MNDVSMIFSPQLFTLAQAAAPPIAGPGGGATSTTTAAQGAPANNPAASPTGAQPVSPFGGTFIWLILAMFVFMIGSTMLSGRKEKKRRASMLSSIARHDRVQTVGGLIGTVSEVKDNEIIVKIDESTNTKIRVVRSAVQQVLKKAGESREASPAEPAATLTT